MKMPSRGVPVAPRALQPWSRALQASLAILTISTGSASAQTGRNEQEAHAQWRRLKQAEVNCVDRALRARNSNLWSLIQQGVGPSDRTAADLRASCRVKTATNNSSTITTSTHQISQAQPSKRESSLEPPREYWSLDESTLNLVAEGDSRKFYYYQLQPDAQAAGATRGALLLEGKLLGTRFAGTAYKYDRRCGRVPYRVDGMFRDNNLRLELQGQSPRIDVYCVMQGTELSSLTLKAVDSTLATARNVGAGKAAVRSAAASNVQGDKLASESAAADQPATNKPTVDKMAAVEAAAAERAATKKGAAGEATANPDVMQVASIDKAGAVEAATERGATELIIPLNPIKEHGVTSDGNKTADRPVFKVVQNKTGETSEAADTPATGDPEMAPAKQAPVDAARPDVERAQTEAAKTRVDGDIAQNETGIAMNTATWASVAAEIRLSFVYGLLSGMASAGALALLLLARQRRRRAQPATGTSRCEFDLLIRAVLAEQNRLNQSRLKQDRAAHKPAPSELVPG